MYKASLGGSKYFMLIVVDFSKFMWVYFLSSKLETFSMFIDWKNLVKKESSHTLKAIHSDHGLEFTLHASVDFYSEFGIHANVGTTLTLLQKMAL